jgi:acetolactate synthase-1/2/3 large subunit
MIADDHPLYAGRPGSVGQRGANFTLQNADCLISLGARLDFGQTGYNRDAFARAARKIIVDIDPAEVAKLNTPVDLPIAADARDFLREFLAQRERIAPRPRKEWMERVQDWKRRYPVVLAEYWDRQDGVSTYCLLDSLSDAMSSGDLLVPGSSGACSEITMQTFRAKPGLRVFNSEGLGPMGFGIPAAIGGCLASGKRRTVSIDGDGGFHMNSQELETVRRLNLPIKFFVLNNNGYGSIKATQNGYFGGFLVASDPSSGLTLPDTLKIAAAYGIPTVRIHHHGELREKVAGMLLQDGPVVCEVMVSPEDRTSPKVSSAQRPDGTMVSKPLEDLWPFLDRDEFRGNMLIPAME